MANEIAISWPYQGSSGNTPYMDIRLKSPSGEIYPNDDEPPISALIDTGYDGEIFIPKPVYDALNFDFSEAPSELLYVASGERIEVHIGYGFIIIPGLDPFNEFEIKMQCFFDNGTGDILIGNEFIKKFKILLDGPSNQTSIII